MSLYRVTLKFSPHLTGYVAAQPQRFEVTAQTAAAAVHRVIGKWIIDATAHEQQTLGDVIVAPLSGKG